MNPVFAQIGTTIFEAISRRARETGAINLGQGFPDARGPADVLEAAAKALLDGDNQYPPMTGLAALREAVAAHYCHHQGLDLDPSEVIVTSGATEALAATILALVTPGDTVLMFPPLYDAYLPLVERAGGVAKLVGLTPPDWRITRAQIDAAGPARFVIVNTPLNPTGSVMNADELAILADYCTACDAILIADEVWEHLVFDGMRHVSPMTVPGMRGRTVKIGSAGKIFSLTGWKVGWISAAPALAGVIAKAHQFLTFTTPPNLQAAVAYGMAKDDSYFADMRAGYQRSRDRLVKGFDAIGLKTLPCASTWFVNVDLAASGIARDDVAFCDHMLEVAGVAAIPVSAFYPRDPVRNIVRFCHAKSDATIDEALSRLALI